MSRVTSNVPWSEIGDLVCSTLESVRENQDRFEAEADRRNITLEQLTSAAIVEAMRRRIEEPTSTFVD